MFQVYSRVQGVQRFLGFWSSLRRGPAIVLFLLLSLACVASGCGRSSASGHGLLSGRTPTKLSGVTAPERLNDGNVPAEGTAWNTNRTALFSSRHAFVEYDLGAPQPVGSIALLGDNNDLYQVLGSMDGENFAMLWSAGQVNGAGLRWRTVNGVEKEARYLRVQPKSGDASLSIAEVAIFSEPDVSLPPRLNVVSALNSGLLYRNSLLVFASVLLIFVGLTSTATPFGWNALLGAFVLWAGFQWARIAYVEYPFEKLEVSLTRAVSAILAAGVVARETFRSRRASALPGVHLSVLGLATVLSVASFFNLGRPQFYDAKNHEPSVVHNYDMRVYFPVAKYFAELKYDGLYLASVATYAEEHGGLDTAEMRRTELRDLRDHRMRQVSVVRDEIEAIKGRFSEARWAQLKEDMRYFWETMGNHGYLSSMADHGGNATPVWLTIAYLMFKSAPASNEVLIWAGLLDPLLLLIFAGVVWRSFGARTALVSLIVFGANDFYMFGSNWAGATLRNDWMVYLGLGACALKTGRNKLGGALLAMSALIRAFPAVSLLALGVPVLYEYLDEAKERGTFGNVWAFLKARKWFMDALIGATVCVVGWVLVSSLVLGFDAWPLWVKKISSFTASPHVNHISLLTMTAGSEGNQALVLRERFPLHVGLSLAYAGLALWAAYKKPPHVAALLGILLMPIVMYPANYYIHFIFVLVLLVDEPLGFAERFAREASGKVWLTLLLLCSALYMTVRENDLALHFYNASVLLMAALAALLVFLLPRDEQGLIVLPGFTAFLLEGSKKSDTNETPSSEPDSGSAAEVAPTEASGVRSPSEEASLD